MTHSVVVRGGTVVDGTGAPPRTADVAVDDGVVTEVGRVATRGRHEVDADGLLVTPGFVDVHTHYDGQATWDSRLAPSSWHGVTTVVMGNCGVGFAPVREADHDVLVELMEGVEDIPGSALHEGLSWDWTDFPAYLDALERLPHDVDLAAQVPHGALRLHVMGQRGADRDDATIDEIETMGALAAQAVAAGALGFTTSRTRTHRTSRGDYTPTLTAAHRELIGIAAALGRSGAGVLQVVSDFLDEPSELELLRSLAATSDRPLSFSLLQSPVHPDQWRGQLRWLEDRAAEGLPIRAQVPARGVGVLFGLQCTLHPFKHDAEYARLVGDVPAATAARRMADAEVRTAVLGAFDPAQRGVFEKVHELGDPPDYEPAADTSIAARARAAGVPPEALAWDVLAADEGRTFLYFPFLNYAAGTLDPAGEMLAHPLTIPGLSDGGAHVGTICDASFPTTLLVTWVRDRASGRLPVEEVVRRQCRDTAAAVGLADRGVLAPGFRADLNVIDLDGLRLHRPEMAYDLPAGGKRLLQRVTGYRHTFVDGVETYRDGEATGELPGRLVRGAQRGPR